MARRTAALAKVPNVNIKLGGLGMRVFGFDFGERPIPPSSDELACGGLALYRNLIEAFGPHRWMFESNFPVDKGTCSYAVLWNSFKRIAAGTSRHEKNSLFNGTARRVYRLKGQS